MEEESQNFKDFIALYEQMYADCGGCETCDQWFGHLRPELERLGNLLTEEEKAKIPY